MCHNYSPGRRLNNYGTLWAGAAIYKYIYICVYTHIYIYIYIYVSHDMQIV